MVITCFSPTTLTLSAVCSGVLELNIIAPPIRTAAAIIDIVIVFVSINLFYQKSKSGAMIPMATNALMRLKIPKNITTSPAVLKNIPDCAFL